MDKLERVWDRIRQGRHTAVIGSVPEDLPATCGFYAVRVSCSGPQRALGPMLDARQLVEELLGGPLPILDQAAARVWTGLRRRLLGEVPEVIPGGAIVESLNRLHRQSEDRWVVCIEGVEESDEDTLHLLRELLTRPHWLQVPLLLSFNKGQPQGSAGVVLAALIAAEGPEGVIQLEGESSTEVPRREPLAAALRELTTEVRLVLRAGALIGSGFEAALLARLLDLEPTAVLQRLQEAADAGVLLEDNGDGRFDLADDLAQSLRASTLPSLAIAWHRRLAEILSDGERPPATGGDSIAPSSATADVTPAIPTSGSEYLASQPASAAEASPPDGLTGLDGMAPLRWPYSEVLAGPANPVSEPAHESTAPHPASRSGATPGEPPSSLTGKRERSGAVPRPAVSEPAARDGERVSQRSDESGIPIIAASNEGSARTRVGDTRPLGVPRPPQPASSGSASSTGEWLLDSSQRKIEGLGAGNEARAASHLVAAGEIENGAARFLVAAREAAAVGAYVQAVAYAREALSLIEGLPAAPRRRRLRVLALCELGRVQWQAVGPGGKFTLASALDSLDSARHLLEEDDPPDLRATVATLLASVCYDLGDLKSLERALTELTEASRALLGSGDALGAARLLNDQAAVYVRLGDPVRASHLLEESRRVFEQRASNDPLAAAELAETYHLLARLPLHVAARPGREADAMAMARDYALAAEAAYRRLGAARELTRVWETMGRIEMRAQRMEPALRNLTAALEAQRELGDVLGLARTTAALAELLAHGDQAENALHLLAESIQLNVEKGSPIGLAYNRRSLEALTRAVPPQLTTLHREIYRKLSTAEASLGRIKLPGERD